MVIHFELPHITLADEVLYYVPPSQYPIGTLLADLQEPLCLFLDIINHHSEERTGL